MTTKTPPRVMTIAGTDSGGGAGVAADLRALTACGVHGCLAVTAVTVQNSLGVTGVHPLPPETVAAQIEAVATDIGLDAAKTGMLATPAIIEAIAEACDRVGIGADGPTPLVVDPVAASMHGDPLLADEALDAFRTLLFPRATLLTPNLDEVRLLVGLDVHDRAAQYEAAKLLHALGPRYVLVKGGHLRGGRRRLRRPALRRPHLHRAARTAVRHRQHPRRRRQHGVGHRRPGSPAGMTVPEAVAFGKRYVVEAVRHSYPLGAGHGPVSPLWAIDPGGSGSAGRPSGVRGYAPNR